MKTIVLLTSLGLVAGCALPGRTGAPAEPAVQRHVAEDDAVRIEELRVRGQVQQVHVQPKAPGARGYEIGLGRAGQDPSQARDGQGQRVWSVLSF